MKLFAFLTEPVFTFIPEPCSRSSRKTVRNHLHLVADFPGRSVPRPRDDDAVRSVFAEVIYSPQNGPQQAKGTFVSEVRWAVAIDITIRADKTLTGNRSTIITIVGDTSMATTTLFFELLVIGVQSSIGIVLLLLLFVDRPTLISFLQAAQPWANAIAIVLIGVLYSIGLIVDRICDAFFIIAKPWVYTRPRAALTRVPWISKRIQEANADDKILVLVREEKTVQYLEYIRSRLRVVRATFLNVLFIAVDLTVAVERTRWPRRASLIVGTWFVTVAISAVTFFAWAMLQMTYEDRHQQAVAFMEREGAKAAGK